MTTTKVTKIHEKMQRNALPLKLLFSCFFLWNKQETKSLWNNAYWQSCWGALSSTQLLRSDAKFTSRVLFELMKHASMHCSISLLMAMYFLEQSDFRVISCYNPSFSCFLWSIIISNIYNCIITNNLQINFTPVNFFW